MSLFGVIQSAAFVYRFVPVLPSEDNELVNEVLEDISRHEEDYLDLTLEEESELIAVMKSYLKREPAHTV